MSYQQERDQFIARMTREGLPLQVTVALLRASTTLNRYAELGCSSEAADRDRVDCPRAVAERKYATRKIAVATAAFERYPCLCDNYQDGKHESVPRYRVREAALERRISAMLAGVVPARTPAKGGGYLCTCGHNCAPWDKTCGGCRKADPIPGPAWDMETQGDPRGYVLKVIPPSYQARNQGRDKFNRESIGVPCRDSGIKW